MNLTSTVLVVASLVAGSVAAAPRPNTSAFRVEASLAAGVPAHVHAGESFDVSVRVVNTSAVAQSFRIMSCSWIDAWHSDSEDVRPVDVVCSRNIETTVELAPGAADARTLQLTASHRGMRKVRLGFQPIGATTSIWSPPVTVDVVA